MFLRIYSCCVSDVFVVCLDGSAPAYHFDKGFGSGVNNWIVHMEVTKNRFRLVVRIITICIVLIMSG